MHITAEMCWAAIALLAKGDIAAEIPPGIVATLYRLKIVSLSSDGSPQLTVYGRQCYDAGKGNIRELDELTPPPGRRTD